MCIGTTDVHEHGKYLVEQALTGLGAQVLDGGVSVDPETLVATALAGGAQAIAISTYNGVALGYTRAVLAALERQGQSLPVLVGGRLNEIPADSNSGLPVDVSQDIAKAGAFACGTLEDMMAPLTRVAPA